MSGAGVELVDDAAEKSRAAFMRAQGLAGAAERTFAAVLRVRSGDGGSIEHLRTAAAALATAREGTDEAMREAMESTDRLLDALGADAKARVLERGRGTG